MSVPKAPPRHRTHNKPCTYTASERAVLQPFCKKYKTETNKDARLRMMRTEILPALFYYWVQRGDRPQTPEESTKLVQVEGSHCHLLFFCWQLFRILCALFRTIGTDLGNSKSTAMARSLSTSTTSSVIFFLTKCRPRFRKYWTLTPR